MSKPFRTPIGIPQDFQYGFPRPGYVGSCFADVAQDWFADGGLRRLRLVCDNWAWSSRSRFNLGIPFRSWRSVSWLGRKTTGAIRAQIAAQKCSGTREVIARLGGI